ncbi:uroporphyrinogen-III synthase, partial [Cellulomonas shaoxiangyii]
VVARGGARVAAVGPGTRRALEAVGVRVDVVPPVRSTAVDLVAAWPAAPTTTAAPGDTEAAARVLFPRGDLAAPTLADGLTAAGWSVDDPVVYRTVPAGPPEPEVARAWAAGEVDAVLLTSASTVRALVEHLGPPPAGTRVAVIGPSTAAEARRLGLRVDAVAAEQTLLGLVAALAGVVGPSTPTPTEDTP